MNKKAAFLLGAALCLFVTATTYLFTGYLSAGAKDNGNEINFQKIVHGVGIGATTKPSWCYINFDPRIDARCPCIEWPIPGGYCYCPDHAGTVSYIADNTEMGVAIEIIKKR